MARTALARTYRPRQFSDVSAQAHVSETLRAAVRRERVAHAYLFCGPRGVGKTTLARVLAMALNCDRRSDEGEPCGECEVCERIWAGRTSLDVIEIDAASNRGVDDARDLRERAMYAPSEEGRYKVYIVDEAHMLTREAWNALLKILEEPPARVIFVFATTEPQKIQQAAPPILSRCQRFDFRRVGTADLVARMEAVLTREGLEASSSVLLPIARKADGGMRDALSLLDQVLSFSEGAPTSEDVRRVLGLVPDDVFLDLLDIVANRRHADVFGLVQRLADGGYDLIEFQRGLAEFLRSALTIRLDGAATDVPRALVERIVDAVAPFSPGDLLRMLEMVTEMDSDGRFRKSTQQRIVLEALILRFSFMERAVEIEEVLRALGGGDPPEGGWGGGRRPEPPTSSPEAPDGAREPDSDVGSPPSVPPEPATGSPPTPRSLAEDDQVLTADAPAEVTLEGARSAWRAMADQAAKLVPGSMVFMRASRVRQLGDGVATVAMPPETPLDRFTAIGVRRKLEDEFARLLGTQKIRIEFETDAHQATPGQGDGPVRITEASMRADQLRRLTEADPLLDAAVRTFDLEVLDAR